MRLYSKNASPFSAPVRIAVYAKNLDIEIVDPPGGLRSTQYHAINPLGTIPCLILEDGARLPESSAIMEYLEEKFPTPPLLPTNPEARAQVRLLQRIGELHITAQLVALKIAPAQSEESVIRLSRLVRGLAALQGFLSGKTFAAGPELTLADCQLAPALFRVPFIVEPHVHRDLIGAYPAIARYIETSRTHPAVARVLEELAAAF
jgi:glutathione S-transferase